jgi:hypothetical protein
MVRSALPPARAWLRFASNVSLGAKFDGEFATRSQKLLGRGNAGLHWSVARPGVGNRSRVQANSAVLTPSKSRARFFGSQ